MSFRETCCLLDLQEGRIDLSELENLLSEQIRPNTSLIYIQRSRGYSGKSISARTLEAFMDVKRKGGIFAPWWITAVRVYRHGGAPSLGVSLTVGSLIKNPGRTCVWALTR